MCVGGHGYCVVKPLHQTLAGQRNSEELGRSDGNSGGRRDPPPAHGHLRITVTTANRCALPDEFSKVPNYSLSPYVIEQGHLTSWQKQKQTNPAGNCSSTHDQGRWHYCARINNQQHPGLHGNPTEGRGQVHPGPRYQLSVPLHSPDRLTAGHLLREADKRLFLRKRQSRDTFGRVWG